ncbi:hypothetical protein FDT66_03795 [Polaribacter aestuariivivens]|uniref:Lipoprotein n=1 Tax=Polaribacter aestuariivivens TaxID=2304626 RepID=A0A5S3N6X8_9FLAO|nr:hypothetical protein [Polaribacter aestuariivivens]TMM31101.1 hypothetical protein FDT66_03795 [Polaribacter aestuariivivens]
MQKIKSFLFISILASFFSCSSEKDCAKTIIIQNEFTITTTSGSVFYPEITQVVDCSFPEPDIAETIKELPRLSEFSYNVLEFDFTPDTGNNTSRLKYKIELNNTGNKNIKGIPFITTNADGVIVSQANIDNCVELNPDSSCIISYDKEESLDIAIIKNITLQNVEYLVIQ